MFTNAMPFGVPIPHTSSSMNSYGRSRVDCELNAITAIGFAASVGPVVPIVVAVVAIKPTVGLMSIGEEEAKGNDLTKEAFPLLRQLSNINFVGNVEGRDVFSGMVDVIVTDGFTGNVMLKLSEGLTEAMLSMLKRELMATAVTKAGAMLAKPAFRSIKKRLDYTEYGGAPLLGVSRIVVIGHGRSNARAIRNAIRSVKEFSENRTAERIEQGINHPQFTQMNTDGNLRISV